MQVIQIFILISLLNSRIVSQSSPECKLYKNLLVCYRIINRTVTYRLNFLAFFFFFFLILDYGVDKYDIGTGFGHFGIAVEDVSSNFLIFCLTNLNITPIVLCK